MTASEYIPVLAIANRKGGVGKTTVCRNVAEYFAQTAGKRVLLIDLDNQCNLTQLLIKTEPVGDGVRPLPLPDFETIKQEDPDLPESWNGRSSSADIFYEGMVFPYEVTEPFPMPNLDILPGHSERLHEALHNSNDSIRHAIAGRLRKFLSDPMMTESYDLVIIDTGPSHSPILLSALQAATHLLIPFTAEPLSIGGITKMLAMWDTENRRRVGVDDLKLIGLLLNRAQPNRRLYKGFMPNLRANPLAGPHLLDIEIPERALLSQMTVSNPEPVSVFEANETLASVFSDLGAHIHQVIFPNEEAPRYAKEK